MSKPMQMRKDKEEDKVEQEAAPAGQELIVQPDRPHHGLYNQGATCYLNSVLQVLFMTAELHNRFEPQSQTDRRLRKIFEDMKKKTCKTKKVTATLGIENVDERRDAAECLEMILHKVSPQAAEVFKGEMTQVTKCSEGHIINEETKPFWTLPLSLKDTADTTYSVQNSFQQNFPTKTYTGDNMVHCNKCNKKTEETIESEMVEAPQILTLLLKRPDTKSRDKSHRCVDVPPELQLKNKTFKLYGMVNLVGGLQGGYHTATILSNEDNTWYEFHDEQVKTVEEQPFSTSRTYKSQTVYLLMYRATESQMPSENSEQDKSTQEEKNQVAVDTKDEKRKKIEQEDDNAIHTKTDVQPDRPHHGLYNQGATCYLNSVLQVLFMTTESHDRFEPQSQTDRRLRKIFEDMKKKTCKTKKVTATLGIENVDERRDAAECLEMILHKVSPQAAEVFKGEMTQVTKCSEGHIINEETKPFWTLPLSLKDTADTTYSVQNSFQQNFPTKTYTGDNMVHCNKCNKKTEETIESEMVEAPQILTLLLKRPDTKSRGKSHRCVDVPPELQLKNKTFKLYGMVNLVGGLQGGYHTATILSNEDNTWYEFHDEQVKTVEEQPFSTSRTYKSQTVYLLMYRATESQMPSENSEQDKSTQEEKNQVAVDTKDEKRKKIEQEDDNAIHTKTDVQPDRPHHGLYNQGATCYLNSVLQVLFMTTESHDRFEPQSQTDRRLRKIFEDMKKKTCKTKKVTATLGIENVDERRDAAECLEMILHKVSPQAAEVFKGEMTQVTKCSEGHIINEETKPFWTLPLSLKDTADTTYSVQNSFQQNFPTKTYTGDNMVHCNKCNKKTEETIESEMVEAPQILTLLLKRPDTKSRGKSHRCVDVPPELQLKNKTFKLYGMVNLVGSLQAGHHTATILSNQDNTWYEFCDERVNKVEEQPFAESRIYNSQTVNILMYRAMESQMPDEISEQAESTQEERNQVEMDTKDEKSRNIMQEADNEIQTKTVVQPDRLHHGLINQGATCYLNSVLQVLFMTAEFHDRLDQQSQADLQLRKIFEDLTKKTCETENITTTFGIGNVHKPGDAAECLEMILHKVSPQASEVFKGEVTHVTKCSEGHIINEETNPFWTLPLSLRDSSDTTYSVQNSFEWNFQTKIHKGGNMVHCNKCNKETEATSKSEMVEAPQILILLLKRFSTKSLVETHHCVEVPPELQLKKKTFKLYGMVNLIGSPQGGHHTATILSTEDNNWYEFNDEHVNKVEEQLFAKSMTYNSKAVYLLMYRATESQMPSENSEQDKSTQEEKNQVAVDTMDEKIRNIEQEHYNEIQSKTVVQPDRSHYGLYNQGATCYLNSVLQVLFMTTEFHNRLDPRSNTDLQLRKIFEDLKKKTCRTENTTTTFGIENVHKQCDAADCLEMILNEVSPKASEVFKGEMTYVTQCPEGHIINEETNPFWTLPLSLKDTADTTYSVQNSFDRIFQTKTYKGDNMVHCNECKTKTEAKSEGEMVRSPQILILLLKRFVFDDNTMSHVKSDCCVDVSSEIQLKNKKFKLYGMVDHVGCLEGGHYTATILSNEDNTWYEFNDQHVNKLKEQPFAGTGPYNSATVYLLMYRVVQPDRSHHGLINQGATCYLNSVLQVLFMTTEFHDRLDPQSNTDRQLRKIFENLKKKTCRTENITTTFGIEKVYEQRDAAECLEMILNKVSPKASEVFTGELTYITKCSEGHIINEETNPFWTLPLSLKDTADTTYSVQNSFDRIFQTKTYKGDNMVHCNECNKKTEATSEGEMVRSPQILTLLLKRFDFDYNTMSHVKSDCCVDVSSEIQLKNKKFKLYGMVDHVGSLEGGHYTATILSNEDNTWYEFNDEHVNKLCDCLSSRVQRHRVSDSQ
ncbi:uncharacterized protein LOC115590543 isoform X2 [Sparus aurata]|uniref:uncharacterized protein LOC115590543 isoform X2 n=1 Tax=Sparus aurata TaxID=8175 RepID=UPI0011C1A059|nr:uncharacterized protein LOC115590543 isoform X2 [Sparus aurata]